MNRRELLAAIAPAAVAGFVLPQSVVAADKVVASVADRTSSIRITKLTATPMQRKVFLKMETNHGVTGWGEIDQLEPYVAAALARSLFELLDNENPTRIEHLWQKIYRSHRDMQTLSIRRGPWKYLDHPGSGGNRYDQGELKRFALPDSELAAPVAPVSLYNLDTDPGETKNLYSMRADMVKELKALLEESKASGRSAPKF